MNHDSILKKLTELREPKPINKEKQNEFLNYTDEELYSKMKSLCEFHINIPNEVFDSYLKDKKICKFKEDGFEMPYYVIK